MNQNDYFDELSRVDLSKHKGTIGVVVVIILLVMTGYTAVFTVDPEEKAVVLRFGKQNRIVEQGLHYKLPFFMEQEYKVPVQRQLKLEFGFRNAAGGNQAQYAQAQYSGQELSNESLMLTGDLNVASIEWVTQYTITDPVKYLFRVRNVDQTFRDMNEAVLREIVGDRTIYEVLTIGRNQVQVLAKGKLLNLCTNYTLGITVNEVILQDVSPPDPVKPAFNAVNQAEQEKETTIQNALAAKNRVIPEATGTAKRTVASAEGYAIERVNNATGEASRFTQIFDEYQKAPEITRQRIYLETIANIYREVDRKIIIDENANGVLTLLNLDRER